MNTSQESRIILFQDTSNDIYVSASNFENACRLDGTSLAVPKSLADGIAMQNFVNNQGRHSMHMKIKPPTNKFRSKNDTSCISFTAALAVCLSGCLDGLT